MLRLLVVAAAVVAVPAVRADINSSTTDWPQWRGPDRTGVSHETGLLKKWPKDGPLKLWSAKGLGGGYGSPVVAGGKIYGLGKIDGKEYAWCLNEKDGSLVWSKEFAAPGKVGYDDGPRCTPTYDINAKLGPVLYAVGVSGDLVCLKAQSGEKVWSKNYGKDFGGRMMSGWGFSESPLVDGDKLICTPGGDQAALVALNKTTGAVIWKAAIKGAGGSGYASPVKGVVGGIPMYITLFGKSGGVIGVHAETGTELWRYNRITNGTANIPTVIFRDDHVWCSTSRPGADSILRTPPKGRSFSRIPSNPKPRPDGCVWGLPGTKPTPSSTIEHLTVPSETRKRISTVLAFAWVLMLLRAS